MSDTALRGRLIRLAAARPDLRAHLLPLLTDKAACGWDGGESDTMGCGDGTVMGADFNPWVKELGGNTTFGSVPVGASFRFPKSDESHIKVSPKMYQAPNGMKFTTGAGTAVVSVKTASLESMADDKMAKHEKGVSVDPTKDMSPEDAKKWEKQKVINQDKFTKGASASLRMISDPGHGWLEVPVSELARLGIANQISRYSFRKGPMAYLEEDMDAGTYLQAIENAGEPRPNLVEVYQERTPIRNYPSYR